MLPSPLLLRLLLLISSTADAVYAAQQLHSHVMRAQNTNAPYDGYGGPVHLLLTVFALYCCHRSICCCGVN